MSNKREKLIKNMLDNIENVQKNREIVNNSKKELAKYGITEGRVEQVVGDPNALSVADIREVILIHHSLLRESGLTHKNDELYTRNELVESRQYHKSMDTEESGEDGSIVLRGVIDVGEGVYVTTISPKSIAELMDSQVLYYNHDIQRQGKFVRRNNEVIQTPTINKQNIKEIKELLIRRNLVSTTIALNAAIGSSLVGDECTYNEENGTLTISEGTRLDILDGFHRCLASREAYEEGGDFGDFSFILRVSSYTTREAQQYQAQLAKATPIPKARQQELASERLADVVIRHLKADSEIGERISSHSRVSRIAGELVSYNVMADAIEREFPMNYRIDAREVSDWLSEFFEYLIGSFPREFEYNRGDDKSLMSYNKMFSGYIALAARMKNENIEIEKLKSIIQNINFSKTECVWQSIGFLDAEGKVKSNASEKRIAEYFKTLKITEGMVK